MQMALRFDRSIRAALSLICFASGAGLTLAPGQEPAPPPATAAARPAVVAMPNDPKDLLALAAQSNGLTGANIQPWHVKVSFKTFDDSGQIQDEGTIEEFWAGAQKYKAVYKGKDFSVDYYGTSEGVMMGNATGNPPSLLTHILDDFISPFPTENIRKQWILEEKQRQIQSAKLMCLNVTGVTSVKSSRMNGPVYCLDDGRPLLRIRETASASYLHNNVRVFAGQFIPADVLAVQNGKVMIQAHLESINEISEAADADFNPPADAITPQKKIAISSDVAEHNAIKRVDPVYPVEAGALKVEGAVLIRATIGKDGHVSNMIVISGPDELRQAALDAYKQWVYKPYLLDGTAVAVETVASVMSHKYID